MLPLRRSASLSFTSAMTTDEMIQALRRETGLPSLHIDPNNLCRLIFQDETIVNVEAPSGSEVVFLHSPVAKLPPDGREAWFAELLSANLFGRDTGDASLGLDAPMEEILLFQKINLSKIEAQEFIDIFDNFFKVVQYWKNRTPGTGESAVVGDERTTRPLMWVQG